MRLLGICIFLSWTTTISCGDSNSTTSDGSAPNTRGNSSVDVRPNQVSLLDGFVAPDIDYNTVYANTCHCSEIVSPCPDGGSDCVICEDSRLSCSECPRPSDPPAACNTIGLACAYDGAHCTCVAGPDGHGVWSCSVCPC